MRKIREILRLKWVAQRSHREVARSLGVSPGAVASAVSRARAKALTWEAIEALREDRYEFLSQFPTVRDYPSTRGLHDPADEYTFERCKLNFAERENRATYLLHEDPLSCAAECPHSRRNGAGKPTAPWSRHMRLCCGSSVIHRRMTGCSS